MTVYKCSKYGNGCLATGLVEKMYALEETVDPLCQIHAKEATRAGNRIIFFAAALRHAAQEEAALLAAKRAVIEAARSTSALPPRGQDRKNADRQWGKWRERRKGSSKHNLPRPASVA